MKYCVLFILVSFSLFVDSQNTNSTKTSTPVTIVSSSSVTTSVITLSVVGNKFFLSDNKLKGYKLLYSYEDFKKRLEANISEGYNDMQLKEIIVFLDNYFTKNDKLKIEDYTDARTIYNFKIFFKNFEEDCFISNRFILIQESTNNKIEKMIHKKGPVTLSNDKIGEQDQYFLPDGVTSIYGGFKYKPYLRMVKSN